MARNTLLLTAFTACFAGCGLLLSWVYGEAEGGWGVRIGGRLPAASCAGGVPMAALVGLPLLAAGIGRPRAEDFSPEMPAEAVARARDDLPLSDQDDRGGWVRYEPMWDEFDGEALDTGKWWPNNPGWLGRQPAFFWTENVAVKGGRLRLTMRRQEAPEAPKEQGFHTYTSAAVKSKTTVLYGYFEVMARPMRSAGSSSFWFYDSTPEIWTEIDVFEIGAGAPGWERKVNMNLHVMHTPEEKEHWSCGGVWTAPFDLADGFHVYGLEWDEGEIKYYFDGALLRRVENTHWHQPLTLNFDSETMPDWFGLPRDEDLPSTYEVEYVRAWKRR